MSADLAELGRMIGKALAVRQSEPPSVNVHVPPVSVSVDALPLAEAIQAGHHQNATALEGLGRLLTDAVCKSIGNAVALVPEADLSGVEEQLSRLAAAIEAHGHEDIVTAVADVKSAIAENTKAVLDLVKAVSEQNKIMTKSKTVSYDAQGRVVRVEVA
jgi:hypothetical protein